MWNRGTVLGGRYTLVERIGGGAMGEVWRAEDQVLERRVAVKIVLPALLDDADFVLRFRREARILASLSHPSIVDIHDYGEDDEQPDERLAYIVMELVDGRPLDAIRAERGKLPAAEALGIVAQALEALQVAHEQEIVHRDIKPSNLMVTPGGLVKVTDFGIARALAGTKITTSHSVFGTALYMAPEQAEGQGTVAASDLYSIGVVAHELLTGELPFTGETVLEIVLKHVREPAPALPEEFPEPVRAFVARALAKSPGDRHPSAAAMAVAARRAAEGLPDLTPPEQAAGAAEAEGASTADPGSVPTEPAKAVAPQTPTAADGPTPLLGTPVVVGADSAASEISTQPTVIGAPQPVWWKRRRSTALILVPCVIVVSTTIGVVLNLDESPSHSTATGTSPGARPAATGTPSAGGSSTTSGSPSASASASGSPSSGPPSAAASSSAPAGPAQNGGGQQPNPAPNGGGSNGGGSNGGTSGGSSSGGSKGGSGSGASGSGSNPGSGGNPGGSTPGGGGGNPGNPGGGGSTPSGGGAAPSGCGGANWGSITNVGDGLKLGFQGALAGGSPVVMNENTQYGWLHVSSSFDSFYPCNANDPALNVVPNFSGTSSSSLDLRGTSDFSPYFTVAAGSTSGSHLLQDSMAGQEYCMTDHGSGRQVTMDLCVNGDKAQEWYLP